MQKANLKIPYFGSNTSKLIKSIGESVTKTFKSFKFIFISINEFKLKIFTEQVLILVCLSSSVVYLYSYVDCHFSYVSHKGLQLQLRILNHLGLSCRTNRLLITPESLIIRSYSLEGSCSIS